MRTNEQGLTCHNMTTGETLHFCQPVSSEYAAAYGFCEEHQRVGWLLTHAHNGTLDEAYAKLPIRRGKYGVHCGDWSCLYEAR